MAQREKGGRVVFIGNIPYGVSEEQICELFGRAGTVVGFRLVYDKETGRPKGFGFLEYTDVDAAASAVRNMNDFDIMGRTLRVDYSNDNGGGKSGGNHNDGDGGRAPPPAHFNMGNGPPPQMNGGGGGDPSAIPSLPPGVDLPNGVSAPDAISKTLSALPVPQLLDIMSQVKNLANTNPAQASALLAQAPQLGYAIFQALLLLGLVDTSVLGSLIQQSTQQPQPPPQQQAPPPQMQMPPNYPPQHQQPPPMSMPPQQQQPQYASYPPQGYPPMQQNYALTPPVQQPAYQPPPPPQQQQQQPDPAQAQAALVQQLLAMTREQIMALDEGQRQQVLQLRQQFGAPVL